MEMKINAAATVQKRPRTFPERGKSSGAYPR